jgi:hypothetical protein
MQKQQFLRSLKEFDRRWQSNSWWHLASVLALIALMYVLVPFGLRHVPSTVIESVTTRRAIFALSLCTVVFWYVPLVESARRRLARKYPFTCAHCTKSFRQADLAEMGYTEKCRACGRRVFDAASAASLDAATPASSDAAIPSSSNAATPASLAPENHGSSAPRNDSAPRTRTEFLNLMRNFRKQGDGGVTKVTIVLGAVILLPLTLLLLVPVANSSDSAPIIWRSALVLCCLSGVLTYSHIARKRAARRCGLACPSCRHAFDYQELKYLGYSGQCEHCNTQVLL